jgi:hypothetical protein
VPQLARYRLQRQPSKPRPTPYVSGEVVNKQRAILRAKEDEVDLRKCGRCGLAVSAGACDTPPLVFHDRPEQCIEALKRDNICDACAGTGKPIGGGQCMCGGSGKMSDAASYLRVQLVSERARPKVRPGHHPPCKAMLDDEAVCTCGQ